MPVSPTTKYLIPKMDPTALVKNGPADINTALDSIDSKFAGYSEGTLAVRPTSTVGTPGIAGRIYRATDTGQRFVDLGTSWLEVPPPPPALLATWTGRFDSSSAAGDYAILPNGTASAANAALSPSPLIIGTGVVDFPIEGRTSKIQLVATLATNNIAPARTFIPKLIQMTGSGTGSFSILQTGSAITCPSIVSPGTNVVVTSVADVAISTLAASVGLTTLINLSGAPAANSVIAVTLQLFRIYA